MITALDIPDAELDDDERNFLAAIREYGWFNHRIFDAEGDDPDFSYTTGIFASTGYPEVIVFSLPQQTSHDILWDIFRDIQSGSPPETSTRTAGIFGNHDAVLLPVSKEFYGDHLGYSKWFYRGDDFPCLQLIWPDRDGRFPWEAGFDQSFAEDQPDLTGCNWGEMAAK